MPAYVLGFFACHCYDHHAGDVGGFEAPSALAGDPVLKLDVDDFPGMLGQLSP